MMIIPTTNKTFMGYFVLLVWSFVFMEVGLAQNQTSKIKVGVVLDIETTFSKIWLTSINMSLSDFYEDHPNHRTRLELHVRDSMEDDVQASAAALDLIKNTQVSAIIGPTTSMQAEFMIRLANKSQVPTISFSATSPLLTSINSPYFVRATLNDASQVKAIADIVRYYEWRKVVAMYVHNQLGEGIMLYLSDALQNVEVHRSVISPEPNDDQILKELYKLMTMQTRVFVVHMDSRLGFRVIQKAREIGMMEKGYVWILTNGLTHMIRHNDLFRKLKTLEGVIGVRSHVPNSRKLEDFRLRWKREYDAELNVFGLRAYDTITALAKAVEKAGTKNLSYDNASVSSNNMTDLGTLGVSPYGPSLLEALRDVRFMGLSGEFKLVDGQLESSTFDIINFVGNEEKKIGVWSTKLKMSGQVIWPGNSMVVPRGWEIPTNRKKIRVRVPAKRGFLNFVKVGSTDPISNGLISVTPGGYSIDIFEAALNKLPYSVTPEYFSISESPEVDYNVLVSELNETKWDAVVGDITITAHRSMLGDFTLPYTESGVSMLVPLRDDENKNTWVFLKPWSLDLWVTTGCFFVLIGFVVWLFEHRINEDFRGPPHHQIGTSFWFSFSTMVFAHREKVVSNLARFVVVVWCFVVLVLTQSYTANLTSYLTVQRFQPKVTNVYDLIRNKENVGYQRGSFVKDILKDQLKFPESKLLPFGSAQECNELFSSGTIAAAFDEVAYLKAILSEYCSKYAIVEPSFRTAGFGFAFPKNSPLTGDVSRAILNVTQGPEMKNIENKWFEKQSDCPDLSTALSSNRLSLSSFWGLFLIAGIASFLAFLVFVALFLYEHRHTLCDDSEDSLWRKLTFLFRIFDEKDIKSHTFKNSAVHNVGSPITHCTPSPSTVQITPWPPSPSPNREFEIRRVSFVMSEEHFNTQPRYEDVQSDIESGA